jgi:acetylornithine aminotransferase
MKNILNTTGHMLKFKDFVKSDNCSLFDSTGNRYLDLESGTWCTSIGHCHPRITKVITEQSSRMIHSGFTYLNPIIDVTAKKILEITGINDGKCVFLSSGSEAVEYSVQLARSITDKPIIFTMKDCFLSSFGLSGERSEKNWINFDRSHDDNLDKVDFSKIAAFVFEPGSSQGIVNFPSVTIIRKIAERTRNSGGLVIINEVTTGVGRTGEWFGYMHYGIIPDIVAMGKGIGNGYPVSCVAMSSSTVNRVDLEKFHHSQSHQNDPLGAAIALEVICVIEDEGLLKRSNELGEIIRSEINRIKNKYGIIKEVRGRGLMIAVEFEPELNNSVAEIVKERLVEKNIILVKRPGHEVLRIDRAITIEIKDVEYFLNCFEEIIYDQFSITKGQ